MAVRGGDRTGHLLASGPWLLGEAPAPQNQALMPWASSGHPGCSECWPGLAWDCTGHLVSPCLSRLPYFSIPPPRALRKCTPSEGSVHSQHSSATRLRPACDPPAAHRHRLPRPRGAVSCSGSSRPSAQLEHTSLLLDYPDTHLSLPILKNPLDFTSSFTLPLLPTKLETFVSDSSVLIHFNQDFAATPLEKQVLPTSRWPSRCESGCWFSASSFGACQRRLAQLAPPFA